MMVYTRMEDGTTWLEDGEHRIALPARLRQLGPVETKWVRQWMIVLRHQPATRKSEVSG